VYRQRQLRLRVLQALEQRLKQFTTREDLWPLRVPRDPLLLDDIIESVLGDERRGFDAGSLRSRTLLHLEWDGAIWSTWVIALPSKLKLYCDSGDDESRILASAGRNEGDESDRIFLELLSNSGGRDFGIEMAGGPPTRVRSSLRDRAFLVRIFVNLFEVLGLEGDVRLQLAARGLDVRRGLDDRIGSSAGNDLQSDVEVWLDGALA
jgi:hypothetical protein